MASTLLADNGVSSGSAGLKSSADSSGVLALQTTTSGGTATTAVTIDTSQNVGIGTTSPSGKFHTAFNNTGNQFAYFTNNQDSNTGFSISTSTRTWWVFVGDSASNALRFYDSTAAAERMRIDSSGNLLVGGTFGSGFQVFYNNTDGINSRSGQAAGTGRSLYTGWYSATSTTQGTLSFNVTTNGNVTNANNSYGSLSDIKLKENITDATPKLEKLCQVRVVNYNFKEGQTHKQIGVIAQELEQVFPSMVEESPDRDAEGNDLGTTTKQVKYSVFVPMLIKAIQEQNQLITDLTNRIQALEGAQA